MLKDTWEVWQKTGPKFMGLVQVALFPTKAERTAIAEGLGGTHLVPYVSEADVQEALVDAGIS